MRLVEAQVLAALWLARLEESCERIEVAGSVRRKRPEAHDIELVCTPKIVTTKDMFGEVHEEANLLERRLAALKSTYPEMMLKKDGPRMKQIALIEGIDLELYIVRPPAQWGVIMTIRTGPRHFSKWLVTDKRHNGAMPSWMKSRDGALRDSRNKIIETPEERDFFEAIGLDWIMPENRDHFIESQFVQELY